MVAEVEAKATQNEGAPEGASTRSPRSTRATYTPWWDIARVMLVQHRRRSLLGMALMVAQAFFYNALGFFTIPLILTKFYGVAPGHVSWYLLPFAAGNILGPNRAGPAVRRRRPQADDHRDVRRVRGCCWSGRASCSSAGVLTAATQTAVWTAIFFMASCAASSCLPDRERDLPAGDARRGDQHLLRPGHPGGRRRRPQALFGRLIDSGSRAHLLYGFIFAAVLMLAAAVAEAVVRRGGGGEVAGGDQRADLGRVTVEQATGKVVTMRPRPCC